MKKCEWIVPVCLICSGAIMIVLGLSRGEHQIVLEKAIKICLECMGIG